MDTNTIDTSAPAMLEIPASEAPVDSLNQVLEAAEQVPADARGQEKKKRNAVRKAFQSATNALILETAKLLGIVKSEWKLGETEWVSIDFRTFKDKNITPEDLGLFLGIKDKFRSIGLHSNTVCYSSAGHVHAYCVQADQDELKPATA
jgi:hypothetical protein